MTGFALIEGDVTLYDSAGVELAVEDATALPAGTRGFVSVGFDGTNTRFVRVDANGYQVTVGPGTSGAQQIEGLAADGSPPVGNPVYVAGQDGANIQSLKTDTTGRQEVVGGAADGAVPAGNPVPVAGWDGTNVETLRTNSAGRAQQVIYDDSGNPVAVILDNSIYRLETRSTLVGQPSTGGAENKVTTIADSQKAGEYRLQTEARTAPGSIVNIGTGIPANPAALVLEFLMNGGSEDMLVNGSGTPVAFTYAPGAGTVVAVESLQLVFAADDFEFDGSSFGPNSALSNGIKVETDVGGSVVEIFNITQNEDFLRIPGRPPIVNNTGPKDILAASFAFGSLARLDGDDSDQMIVTVRDNLTSVKFKYLTATIYGSEV